MACLMAFHLRVRAWSRRRLIACFDVCTHTSTAGGSSTRRVVAKVSAENKRTHTKSLIICKHMTVRHNTASVIFAAAAGVTEKTMHDSNLPDGNMEAMEYTSTRAQVATGQNTHTHSHLPAPSPQHSEASARPGWPPPHSWAGWARQRQQQQRQRQLRLQCCRPGRHCQRRCCHRLLRPSLRCRCCPRPLG